MLAKHHPCRQLDHWHARDLGNERHGARGARIDLEYVDLSPMHHVLHVHQPAQAQVPSDPNGVVDHIFEVARVEALRGIDGI